MRLPPAHRVVSAALLAGVASCAPPIPQDLQPAATSVAVQDFQPSVLRLVSDAAYTRQGPSVPVSTSPGAPRLWPVDFTAKPRTSFYTAEGIVAVSDITWSEPTSYGGVHTADWRLFQGDRVLKEGRTNERLSGKPARVLSHISAGSFPPGAYRLELMLDRKPFGVASFRLLAPETPAPLAVAIVGPKCVEPPGGDGGHRKLNPVRLTFPEFPQVAEDRHKSGCAAVSIIVDSNGRPTGVRVDAEFPEHAGFGDAAARAAWGLIYPPGHGGETARMTYNFDDARK